MCSKHHYHGQKILLGCGQSNAKFRRMWCQLKIDWWDLLCMNPITCRLRHLYTSLILLQPMASFLKFEQTGAIEQLFLSLWLSSVRCYRRCHWAVVPSLSPLSLCGCLHVDISVVFVSPSSSSCLYCHRRLLCHVVVISAVAVFLFVFSSSLSPSSSLSRHRDYHRRCHPCRLCLVEPQQPRCNHEKR